MSVWFLMSSQHPVNQLIFPVLETDKAQSGAWKPKDYTVPVSVNHDACYGDGKKQELRLQREHRGKTLTLGDQGTLPREWQLSCGTKTNSVHSRRNRGEARGLVTGNNIGKRSGV